MTQEQLDSLTKKEVFEKLYDAEGRLLYEGMTVNHKPFGKGTVYFSDGTKYQEGNFSVKGLTEGTEYFPNGGIRFSGSFAICYAYGPNYPLQGDCYNRIGVKIYSGTLKHHAGGVGYVSITEPEDYGPIVQAESPEINYFMWGDIKGEDDE